MKTMRSYTVIFGLICVISAFAVSCGHDEQAPARLQIRLTDGPGHYESVLIDIQSVEVHTAGSDSSSGWKTVSINSGVYDLLTFCNGLDTLLGEIDLPAGRLSQLRMKLGSNNTVRVDGQTHDLVTPSAPQSGLKINLHTEVESGITYRITLDFDAARSIVTTGSGKFILKPVIRAFVEAQSGAIKGVVAPAVSAPVVFAIIGNDTTSTSADALTGKFMIKGLDAGTYKIRFEPVPGFLSKDVSGVVVTTGIVVDMDTVTIHQ